MPILATILAILSCVTPLKLSDISLGPHTFYVDGSLSAEVAAESPYIFNDFNEAMAHLTDGSAEEPMRVYIAPWVYWVDDPDDPQVRKAPDGGAPIGLTVRCGQLQLIGIGESPEDVVLASARGQSQGAIGNFTMFDFYGNDLVIKNLTMGNYCNIDLVYPLNPSLNRAKRGPAITQAQLAFCHGDRILAENVRFVARLNLCPLSGAKRILFIGCHFECTDDSLTDTGVYLNCDVDTWGRQPFGGVNRYGTVWLNSEINIRHDREVQAISKNVGRHSLVDVRYSAGRDVDLEWTFRPEDWLRCYEYNVSLDGKEAHVGAAKPECTVELAGKKQLAAYKLLRDNGQVLYNTYNLLRGEDDWDPQGIKYEVLALSERDDVDYANIPTCLDINLRSAEIQTGKNNVKLEAGVYRHLGYRLDNQVIHWKAEPGFERFVQLSAIEGNECVVTPLNQEDATQHFNILAYTDEGLQGAVALTVIPDFIEAPTFTKEPEINISKGSAGVDYALDLQGRADESIINWYRCSNAKGKNAQLVATSHLSPAREYKLSAGDVGYYLLASVEPKHLRSGAGPAKKAISSHKITNEDVLNPNFYATDFSDFPIQNQSKIKPGFWTVDAYKPTDTKDYDWSVDLGKPCWKYGTGINGAKGYGLLELQQGARLRYTPVKGSHADMSVEWEVNPAKDGGQGFASARQQYLDFFIKFDTKSLSGYALRVIRTTKYANAVDVLLVTYNKGIVTPICTPVTVDCFLTGCKVRVWTENFLLKARIEGPGSIAELASDANVKHHLAELQANITPNGFGGFGLQHTSTTGDESRILVKSVKAEWK